MFFNWFKRYQLFTKEECDKIILDVENNKDKLKVSSDHGTIDISSYEVNTYELSTDTHEMIQSKLNGIASDKIIQCFIIRYSPDTIPDMPAHYDGTKYSLVVNLNNDFEDGGTYFPLRRYYHDPKKNNIGEGILYKGNKILSWHQAIPVTKGVRYVLNVKYLNDKGKLWNLFTILKYMIYQHTIIKIFSKKYNKKLDKK